MNDRQQSNMHLLYDFLLNEKANFPALCPECSSRNGHIYMHRFDKRGHGDIWVWCSNCTKRAILSDILPEWWHNIDLLNEVDQNNLFEVLENNKDITDNWTTYLLKLRDNEAYQHDELHCHKCHSEVVISNKGIVCNSCGWSLKSYDFEPIYADNTEYSIVLLEGNSISDGVLSVINKVAHIKKDKASEVIETAPNVIFRGNAPVVLKYSQMLELHKVKYCINPEFPYNINV